MGREKGFTIIEVMLFLAVSSALLGVAVIYTANSLKNTRYTDATRSFEAFVEQQYTEVQAGTLSSRMNGSCSTAGAAGASDSCIVLGRVLTFESGSPTKVDVYTVVANASAPGANAGDDIAALVLQDARVQEASPILSYKLDWGGALGSVKYYDKVTSSPKDFNRLAILRSPVSENIYTFTFTQSGTFKAGLSPETANQQAVICFPSSDFGSGTNSLVAAVTLAGATSIDSIASAIKPKSATRVGVLSCS